MKKKRDIVFLVFLVLLIASSSFLGYTLAYILPVFAASGTQTHIASNVYVEVNGNARDKLFALWDAHENKEYSACVRGYSISDGENMSESYDRIILRITDIYKAETGISNQAPLVVCAGELGVIHNHPRIGCTDKIWTGDVQAAKGSFAVGNELFLIQCERDHLEVYMRENLYQGKVIQFE